MLVQLQPAPTPLPSFCGNQPKENMEPMTVTVKRVLAESGVEIIDFVQDGSGPEPSCLKLLNNDKTKLGIYRPDQSYDVTLTPVSPPQPFPPASAPDSSPSFDPSTATTTSQDQAPDASPTT